MADETQEAQVAEREETNIDDFMDDLGAQFMEQPEEPEEEPEEVEEGGEEQEEEPEEESEEELSDEVQKLVEKAEKSPEELTDEDRKALEEAGFEIEEEEAEPEAPSNEPAAYDEILTEFFPDQEFETRADRDQAVASLLGEYQKFSDDMSNIIEKNPEMKDVFKELNNGVDFLTAIGTVFGLEDLAPDPSDPNYEKWVRSKVEKENQLKEAKKQAQLKQNNMLESKKNIQEHVKENKLKDNEIKEIFGKVDQLVSEFNNGLLSKEFLQIFQKGLMHDREVAKAKSQAGIDERNRKIKLSLKKKKGPRKLISSAGGKDTGASRKYNAEEKALMDLMDV